MCKKEDCGSNNVSAQSTDSYSEKKQADRHGETTRSSNYLPRHLPKHELRKLRRKIKKCERKTTTECKKLLRSAAEGTISLNLVKKRYMTKELFNMRICFDQESLETYNPEEKLCCNGLHERVNRSLECCAGEVIDNTQQSCCNDVKYERQETHYCCGTTYYSKLEHTCCQGFLRSTQPDTGCCGIDTYQTRNQICCFNSLVFNITDMGENSCCSFSAAINNDASVCCGGEVHHKHENTVPNLSLEEEQPADGDESAEEENPIGLMVCVGIIVGVLVTSIICLSIWRKRRCKKKKSLLKFTSVNNVDQVLEDPNIDHGFIDQISSDVTSTVRI